MVSWKFQGVRFDRPAKGGAPEEVLNDPDRLKQWKHERAKAHETYTAETYKNLRTRLALSMAREYEHKTFFISYSCDWRGRFMLNSHGFITHQLTSSVHC